MTDEFDSFFFFFYDNRFIIYPYTEKKNNFNSSL